MKAGRLDALLEAAEYLLLWRKDAALAGVREPEELAWLPEAERRDWHQLWEDFSQTLRDAERRVPETRVNTRLLPPEPTRVHRVT